MQNLGKLAVKSQMRLADIPYVEPTPRFHPKDKLSLAVELTDFSVHYSQGLVDAITAGSRGGPKARIHPSLGQRPRKIHPMGREG